MGRPRFLHFSLLISPYGLYKQYIPIYLYISEVNKSMVRFGGFYTPFGGFGPFFRGAGFERGEMKYVILYLLADKPRHGYDIIKEMESRFCGFYAPSPGTIYPTLQLLEDQELVRSKEEDGKRTYEITEKGKLELRDRKEKLDGIWERMDSWKGFRMDDLNDLFEDLAELKKHARMRMHRRGLNADKLKKIRKIIQNAKDEIISVLKT